MLKEYCLEVINWIMKISINNEYSKLKSVIVSSANYFDPNSLALNNETVKYYASTNKLIDKELILSEQDNFWNTLKEKGVSLLIADNVNDSKGQMFTRDLAFVIGDKLFISNMRKENRKGAINGWNSIIKKFNSNSILRVPSNIYLEGGDVIVDNNFVYVGISERTTMDGVNFLKEVLGDSYKIIPLYLKPKFLHLDVVLTIINPNLLLVYKDGLEDKSYDLLKEYEKIELTKEEQFELATNVFVIDKKTIIMNRNHKRLKDILEKKKFKIIALDISETAKLGGAFRCTTCPIERK